MTIGTRQLAAKLGGISRSRVNKLAKQGRITGAQLVSGVWTYPDDARILPPKRRGKAKDNA